MSPGKHQNAESVDGKGFAGEAGLPWGRGYSGRKVEGRREGGERWVNRREFVARIGRRELCGSTRNLECHHIIPLAVAPDDLDLDVPDNWLCVCGRCHNALTPRSLLTKMGLHQLRRDMKDKQKVERFYLRLDDALTSGDGLDVPFVLDVFDDVFLEEGGEI